MKKVIPSIAFLFLIACNSEPAAADTAHKDNAQNKDTMTVTQADSVETRTDTVAETNPIMVPPPPPVAKSRPAAKTKEVAKPKAKLDSVALREASKLPLEQ